MNNKLATAAIATITPATMNAGSSRPDPVSAGTSTAPAAVPSGSAICRIPIANPRPLGWEPADHDPAARRAGGGGTDTADDECESKRWKPHDEGGSERRNHRDHQTRETSHDPLTPSIGGGALQDEREQHSDARCGRQQASLRQRQPTLRVSSGMRYAGVEISSAVAVCEPAPTASMSHGRGRRTQEEGHRFHPGPCGSRHPPGAYLGGRLAA